MHIPSLVKIHGYLLSYCPEIKILMGHRQIIKKLMKLTHLLSQTRSLQYQCTHQVWWKSIDIYWSYHPETKNQTCRGQITLSNIDEICPLAIPDQISTISMHIPSLVKIHWHSFTEMKIQTDGRLMDDQLETTIPCNYHVVRYKRYGIICSKF